MEADRRKSRALRSIDRNNYSFSNKIKIACVKGHTREGLSQATAERATGRISIWGRSADSGNGCGKKVSRRKALWHIKQGSRDFPLLEDVNEAQAGAGTGDWQEPG